MRVKGFRWAIALAAIGIVLAVPALGAAAEKGRFVVRCDFSHESRNDPIALFRAPGLSHLHEFFGNTSTNARSTARKLRRRGDTTCNSQDRSAYWAPALSINGQVVRPDKLFAYYVSARKNPRAIETLPKGLKIIGGNGSALTPQPASVTTWGCTSGLALISYDTDRPLCPSGQALIMSVLFPDCWDGAHLDSADHQSHMAYAAPPGLFGGYWKCPPTHPVPVPQLQMRIMYPTSGASSGVTLSSGGMWSGHADFINAWPKKVLADIVNNCIRGAVNCAH
jgi:hypothetical protein